MTRPNFSRQSLTDPGPFSTAIQPETASSDKQARTGSRPVARLEPLLSLDDVATMLAVSRRWMERERAAGRVPKPDFMAGKCPRWKSETVHRWIEMGGRS